MALCALQVQCGLVSEQSMLTQASLRGEARSLRSAPQRDGALLVPRAAPSSSRLRSGPFESARCTRSQTTPERPILRLDYCLRRVASGPPDPPEFEGHRGDYVDGSASALVAGAVRGSVRPFLAVCFVEALT